MGLSLPGLWRGLSSTMPLLCHAIVSLWCVFASLWWSWLALAATPRSPKSSLTHLVVMRYGCFAQLSFEIQLEGKVQVTLQTKRERTHKKQKVEGNHWADMSQKCEKYKKLESTIRFYSVIWEQQNTAINKLSDCLSDNKRTQALLLLPREGGGDTVKVNNRIVCLENTALLLLAWPLSNTEEKTTCCGQAEQEMSHFLATVRSYK